MTMKIEGNHSGEFLLSEGNGFISREAGVLAPRVTVTEAGTLLGRVTAGGALVPYANGATDGSETCVGILYHTIPANTDPVEVSMIARNAEVKEAVLTGLDAAGRADLAALGIIVR